MSFFSSSPNSGGKNGYILVFPVLTATQGTKRVPNTYEYEDVNYTYDDRNQLDTVDYTATPGIDEDYDFDENGNRTSGSFTVTADNRLATDGTYNYTYDNEGNIERRTKIADSTYTEYTWDHRNRLVQVTEYNASDVPQLRIEYSYDANNDLVRRHLFTGTSTTPDESQVFVYDGGKMVLELDGTTDVLNKNDLAHRYLWGPGPNHLLVDEAVASLTDADLNESRWALPDHLGTLRDWIDDDAALLEHAEYDSFGQRTDPPTQGFETTIQWTGMYRDPHTGLQRHGARWYDPTIGRWLSEDPIKDGLNWQAYVGNEVTTYVDWNGLKKGASWSDPLNLRGWIAGEQGAVPDTIQSAHGFFPGWSHTEGVRRAIVDTTRPIMNRFGQGQDSVVCEVPKALVDELTRKGPQRDMMVIPLSGVDMTPVPMTLGHVQMALDAAGMIPAYGFVFDLINAGIYTYNGDAINATISLGAAIPIAGQFIGGSRLGFKGFRFGDEIAAAVGDAASNLPRYLRRIPHQKLPDLPVMRQAPGECVPRSGDMLFGFKIPTQLADDMFKFVDGSKQGMLPHKAQEWLTDTAEWLELTPHFGSVEQAVGSGKPFLAIVDDGNHAVYVSGVVNYASGIPHVVVHDPAVGAYQMSVSDFETYVVTPTNSWQRPTFWVD